MRTRLPALAPPLRRLNTFMFELLTPKPFCISSEVVFKDPNDDTRRALAWFAAEDMNGTRYYGSNGRSGNLRDAQRAVEDPSISEHERAVAAAVLEHTGPGDLEPFTVERDQGPGAAWLGVRSGDAFLTILVWQHEQGLRVISAWADRIRAPEQRGGQVTDVCTVCLPQAPVSERCLHAVLAERAQGSLLGSLALPEWGPGASRSEPVLVPGSGGRLKVVVDLAAMSTQHPARKRIVFEVDGSPRHWTYVDAGDEPLCYAHDSTGCDCAHYFRRAVARRDGRG